MWRSDASAYPVSSVRAVSPAVSGDPLKQFVQQVAFAWRKTGDLGEASAQAYRHSGGRAGVGTGLIQDRGHHRLPRGERKIVLGFGRPSHQRQHRARAAGMDEIIRMLLGNP